MKRWIFSLLLNLFFVTVATSTVQAASGEVLGVHILNTGEVDKADQLLKPNSNDSWRYVTIPLSLTDLEKKEEWQKFFDVAQEKKLIPIVRLVTKFENGAWKVPNKKEVVELIDFLNELNWPTSERYVVVFNEPNHSKEWGGQVNPEGYAQTLRFASNWAHATNSDFKVLPAGLDLAAPNGSITLEAFNYLDRMYAYDPEIFNYVDDWNSHSYPNPGFSSSPQRNGQNSLQGFKYELDYLKQKTGRDYQVFITETGWSENNTTRRWLASYYQYAIQHVWSDPRVKAVTPFILQGDPGPFASFSFINKSGQPTYQYAAYQEAIKKLEQGS
jgi:hypothetical protein